MPDDASALIACAAAANGALQRVAAPQADPQHLSTLESILDDVQTHVLALSTGASVPMATVAPALMDAGISLYNASRSTLKGMAPCDSPTRTDHDDEEASSLMPQTPKDAATRFAVIAARFQACEIMRAALRQAKCRVAHENDNRSDQSRYVNECIDVLRSFGRVGSLLLAHAKADPERCQQYVQSANAAFAGCHEIWSQIGLSCLTKLKHDLELEEILDDLWDFNMDRIRVLQLTSSPSSAQDVSNNIGGDCSASVSVNDTIEALGELQMLVPYMPGYRLQLLQLLMDTSGSYKAARRHQELVLLTEEALRVCDSTDCGDDEEEMHRQFKQKLLVNVLGSFGAIQDFQRAETCFSLLPHHRDPDALLIMVQIYVDAQRFDKALGFLRTLFELGDLEKSIHGARLYAQAQAYSDGSLEVYQELEQHVGTNNVEINLDVACNLALTDIPERRALAMAELKRLASQLQALARDDGDSKHAKHVERIHRTVFDATSHALNQHAYQECIEWSNVGIAIAACERESSLYMRMLSLCFLRLEQRESALKWAKQAVATEPSKKSLFALFNAELEGLSSGDTATERIKAVTSALKARDDFEVADLVALAKAAHDAGPAKQAAVLGILDDICSLAVERVQSAGGLALPIGILLQQTAQLAHTCDSDASSKATSSGTSPARFAESLTKYARQLLCASATLTIETLGPASVFEWFYAMSFNAAKSAESAELFVVAAELARMSGTVYRDKSPLQQRESQCLLAAIACSMKTVESLDKAQLHSLLGVVERCEACLDERDSDAEIEYLARCVFTIKVRLFDPNTNAIFKLCQAKIPRQASEFAHLAEFVVYAATFDDASKVRQSYRHLASDLFKYGLQTMLQSDAVAPDTLCYLFRRLISLAEGKAGVLEWLEQFLQLAGSLDIQMPDDDVEWMVAKAWNVGILHHRSQEYAQAHKFMDVALHLLEISKSLADRMRSDLQTQYQYFLSALAPTHPAKSETSDGFRFTEQP